MCLKLISGPLMAIRYFSTPLSADRGEISILSVAETISAILISFGFAWFWGTAFHIAVSASLAPLFLLRTKRSTVISIKLLKVVLEKLNKYEGFIYVLLWFLVLPFAVVTIKIIAISVVLITRPLSSLSAIPFNWRRIVLGVDSHYPPELVPGWERYASKNNKPGQDIYMTFWPLAKHTALLLQDTFRTIKYNLIRILKGDPIEKEIMLKQLRMALHNTLWLASSFFSFLISIPFRFSLKSTAIIWSPLLWIFWNLPLKRSIINHFILIKTQDINKFIRFYSVVIIILFSIKLYVYINLSRIADGVKRYILETNLTPYIEPKSIPSWQIASATNAIITWGIYLFADSYLKSLDVGDYERLSPHTTRWILGSAIFVRCMLSLWVIYCLLYLAWLTEWPHFAIQWAPWR
jgi:hypothetical protein